VSVDSSARNRLFGTVAEIADLGATVRLKVTGDRLFTATIARRSFFEVQLNIGSEVCEFFKATSVQVL